MSLGRRTFGILWTLVLVWILYCAWSFWVAESSPLEGAYFAARDAIQPGGYAVGRLRRAPTWALFHLALGSAPAAILLAVRGLLLRD